MNRDLDTWSEILTTCKPGSKASLVIRYVGPIWSNSGHTLGRYWRRFQCIVCTSYMFLYNCDAMQVPARSTDSPCRPYDPSQSYADLMQKEDQVVCQELPGESDWMMVILVYGQHKRLPVFIRSSCNSRFPNKHCFLGWACIFTSKNKHYRYQGTGMRPF